MSVSTNAVIIGVAFGALLAVAMIIWRRYYRDLFGGFLVLGLLALAVVVLIYQVSQFREQSASTPQIAQTHTPAPTSGASGSTERPQRFLPTASGLRGGAAPPAVQRPAAGNP